MDERQVPYTTSEPWTEKYRPDKISEVVGNRESITKFLKWIESWEDGKPPSKKAALLYGPQGVGKTSLVQALARERGYDLVEMNASDWRSAEKIERVAERAAESSTLEEKKRIILLDEAEGVHGKEDRGGLAAIIKLQNKTHVPIILTANDPWHPKFSTLRSHCLMIKFDPIDQRTISALLGRIAHTEGVEVNTETLQLIAKRAEGDARAAVLDLQTLSEGAKRVTIDEAASLPTRENKESVFNTLRGIFSSKSISTAVEKLDSSEVDYEMLFEWIYENIPREYGSPIERSRAMDAIAEADVIFSRIRKRQNWRLLPYALEMMTGGVALSRKTIPGGWVPYQFPGRIRDRQSSMRRREIIRGIGGKIASKCSCSTKSALRAELPYIRVIFSSSVEEAARISTWLGLTEAEIESLSNNLPMAKKITALAKS